MRACAAGSGDPPESANGPGDKARQRVLVDPPVAARGAESF